MSFREIIRNPGFVFIVKFLVLFLGFHFGCEFLIGVTAPGGLYVQFVDEHLDLIAWLRESILYGANQISNLLGYPAYIDGPYHLRSLENGQGVQMVYSCIGYGIMSFWAGFVLAHASPWKKKLLWTLLGLIVIWIINCFRVAIILIAGVKNWNINRFIDHHDFFNLVAYLFIFILIILFLRKQGLQRAEVAPTT